MVKEELTLFLLQKVMLKLLRLEEIVHLGNTLNSSVFKYDASKCVTDYHGQCNSFLSRFKGGLSHARSNLLLNIF